MPTPASDGEGGWWVFLKMPKEQRKRPLSVPDHHAPSGTGGTVCGSPVTPCQMHEVSRRAPVCRGGRSTWRPQPPGQEEREQNSKPGSPCLPGRASLLHHVALPEPGGTHTWEAGPRASPCLASSWGFVLPRLQPQKLIFVPVTDLRSPTCL